MTVGGSEYIHCTYDGKGRCVLRTEGGVTPHFAYDDWNPIQEWDASGNTAQRVYGSRPDELILGWSNVYGYTFYKLDRLGNVVSLLDSGGNIVEKYTYDAFGQPSVTDGAGNPRGNSSAWGNRFMFNGREWLISIGCYDYRNRIYQPTLGRFLQMDPKGFEAGDMEREEGSVCESRSFVS